MTLTTTAQALVSRPKGLLAADESEPTITKRFSALGIPSTKSTRCAYRELLLTSPTIERYLSGVILYDETFRQTSQAGRSFPRLLVERGLLPGIKIDQGLTPLPSSPDERLTNGLEGLEERLAAYVQLGARFTKWRSVVTIRNTDLPTTGCLEENARRQARAAKLAQQAGLVPIVEPEVLADGDHSIEACESATRRTLAVLFTALAHADVNLAGLILKPNMVTSGLNAQSPAPVDEVAERTVALLESVVSPTVAGIVFLSGGQSPALACERLSAINRLSPPPWPVSFSFSRALQNEVLAAWRGVPEHVTTAQTVFAHRAQLASLATAGAYSTDLEPR